MLMLEYVKLLVEYLGHVVNNEDNKATDLVRAGGDSHYECAALEPIDVIWRPVASSESCVVAERDRSHHNHIADQAEEPMAAQHEAKRSRRQRTR